MTRTLCGDQGCLINQLEQPKPTPVITKATEAAAGALEVTVPVPVEDTRMCPSTAPRSRDRACDADSAAVDTPISTGLSGPPMTTTRRRRRRMSRLVRWSSYLRRYLGQAVVDPAGCEAQWIRPARWNYRSLVEAVMCVLHARHCGGGSGLLSRQDFRVNLQR